VLPEKEGGKRGRRKALFISKGKKGRAQPYPGRGGKKRSLNRPAQLSVIKERKEGKKKERGERGLWPVSAGGRKERKERTVGRICHSVTANFNDEALEKFGNMVLRVVVRI